MKGKIKTIIYFIVFKINYYTIKRKNIILGKNVKFNKKPLIQINKNAKLIIGNHVVINSNNKRYHLNMFSSCKFLADKPNAVIEIGDNTRFHGSCIHAYNKVKIGKNCLIAANTQIIDGNGHNLSFPNVENRINTQGDWKEVIIEDNVWIGTGVVVLPGVTIGTGSIISANSVVHRDIPPMAIAGGNPIVIIKNYNS
jgi:acetyltransferase-like isoleucine patch superfamily enzyme